MVQHPCHTSLPQGTEEQVIALLSYYSADRIINPEDSVVVFSRDTALSLLDLVKSFRDNADIFGSAANEPLKTLTISRSLRIID